MNLDEMTTDVNITATCLGGKPLEVLGDLIAKRVKYLNWETTEMAVTATAINILTSVRSATKVAKPDRGDFGCVVRETASAVAGFKSNCGMSGPGRRVVRVAGGHEITAAKVVNTIGPYMKGERPKVFTVVFKSKRLDDVLRDKYERCYIIARNEAEAKTWALKRVRKYIKDYAGTAKWALGQAQSQVSQWGYSVEPGEITGKGRKAALENILVETTGSGFSSGVFTVYVSDRLRYSVDALKNGEADFQTALMKAANKTAGIIKRMAGYRLDEPIPTPFPEVKR